MSQKYPGGLITKSPVTPSGPYENSTASGIWTLDQQAYWQKLGQWPTAGNLSYDPQFNYVTMLLHGDGTNGAQNNTFLDSSTNNFTITRNGNTTQGSFSPYGSNWSNYFDGSQYLVSDNIGIIAQSYSEWTVECFVFVTGSSNNQKFATQGTTGNAGRFTVGIEGGNWWVQIGSNVVQTGTPVRNQWNYVAVTYDSTILKLYVNGSLIGSVSTTQKIQNTTFRVGTDWNNYYTTGYISNVCVTNAIKTVTTIPTAPFTDLSDVALLICQSNRFKDSSSFGWLFTDSVFPSVQRFNPFGASTAYSTSVIGGSGYFDGSGDYLNTASNAAFTFGSSGNFTVECWVYLNGSQSSSFAAVMTNMANFSNAYAGRWAFTINALNLRWYNSIGEPAVEYALTPYQWLHLAAVRNGSVISVYVNGVEVGAQSSGQAYTTEGSLKIGFLTSAAAFNGYIADARVVKGTAVYTTEFTPPTAPLTAVTNTSLLTNFTNGAIFDNAMINDLETAGTAQISTSVVKYGTGSINNNGTTSFPGGTATKLICRPNPSFSFGTGDFTVEGWFYQTTVGSTYQSILEINNHLGADGILFIGNSGGVASVYAAGTGGGGFVAQQATTANVWQHIAFVRNNGTLRTYVDGVSTSSQPGFTLDIRCTIGLTIGGERTGDGNYNYYGYMDEFRVTRYARYTANFTPPSAAFFNTGPT